LRDIRLSSDGTVLVSGQDLPFDKVQDAGTFSRTCIGLIVARHYDAATEQALLRQSRLIII